MSAVPESLTGSSHASYTLTADHLNKLMLTKYSQANNVRKRLWNLHTTDFLIVVSVAGQLTKHFLSQIKYNQMRIIETWWREVSHIWRPADGHSSRLGHLVLSASILLDDKKNQSSKKKKSEGQIYVFHLIRSHSFDSSGGLFTRKTHRWLEYCNAWIKNNYFITLLSNNKKNWQVFLKLSEPRVMSKHFIASNQIVKTLNNLTESTLIV